MTLHAWLITFQTTLITNHFPFIAKTPQVLSLFYMYFVASFKSSFPTKQVDVCQLHRHVLELFISYHPTVLTVVEHHKAFHTSWHWPRSLTSFSKTLPLIIIYIRLSYFTFVFLVIRPFTSCHNFYLVTLALNFASQLSRTLHVAFHIWLSLGDLRCLLIVSYDMSYRKEYTHENSWLFSWQRDLVTRSPNMK